MVAHFEYYQRKGSSDPGPGGVVLIARTVCGQSKMNATENKTTGAYKSSLANTTACPAIASALQTVLGSYLLSPSKNISMEINENAPSMAGANWSGASSNYEWVTNRCILPSEIQVYGANVTSSSLYDVGEACEKLAVFNFINTVEFQRSAFWLRNVATKAQFSYAGLSGIASAVGPVTSFDLRPLIYIG